MPVTPDAHLLDNAVVLDPDGREIRMGTLWDGQTAVLVFVRHFGCLFCKQQIAGIVPFLSRIRAAGAELFVIGPGTIEDARAFRDEHRLAMPLLTDPTRRTYRVLGMRHGGASALKLAVIGRTVTALRQGFRQTRTAGDPLQQGGVLVIGEDGRERYRYISRYAGDHPAPDDILRHCEVDTSRR